MSREEDITILMELGLTLLQAKAYIALISSGTATIKTLAKTTGIAKHDVYRIMPQLQALGLAERIVAPKATYKVVPVEDAASTLLQYKTEEHIDLRKKTAKLIDHYKNNYVIPVQKEESYFRIISEKFLFLRTLDNLTSQVNETIDFARSWEFTKGMLFRHSPDILERALKRGVRIRWITEKHDKDRLSEKILKTLTAYPHFRIKYVANPIRLRIATFDRTDAIMCLSNSSNNWMSNIWSNNEVFVKAITDCYEQMWHTFSEKL